MKQGREKKKKKKKNSAENGCFFKRGGEWTKIVREVNNTWMNEAQEILEYYAERTQGSEIESREYSIAWYYQAADAVYG